MAQTINTNIASLNAQRNLSTSQSALSTSLQRLSSACALTAPKTTPLAWLFRRVSARRSAATPKQHVTPMTVSRWHKRLKVA